jgi:hypothetical protein
MMARREYRETELGIEARSARCRDFWPVDPEFYFIDAKKGPHSYCKACYNDWCVAHGRRKGTGTLHRRPGVPA